MCIDSAERIVRICNAATSLRAKRRPSQSGNPYNFGVRFRPFPRDVHKPTTTPSIARISIQFDAPMREKGGTAIRKQQCVKSKANTGGGGQKKLRGEARTGGLEHCAKITSTRE